MTECIECRLAFASEGKNQQIECRSYAYANGIDKPEILHWKWPY